MSEIGCRKCGGVTRYAEWGLCDGCHATARYHFNECPGCGLTEREDVEGPLDSYSSFYCDKCDGDLGRLPFNQAVARDHHGAGRRSLLAHHTGATRALERHGLHGGHGAQYPWERHDDLPRDEGWVLDHNGEWRQA